MAFIQILAGFVLLGFGGDLLVRGAVAVARVLGVSTLFIGLVLVGFGTSMPELAASLRAAFQGAPDISVGNVMGSNIANMLLILGVTATLATVRCDPAALRRDGSLLLAVTFLLALFVVSGAISRAAGGFLVTALIAYIVYAYISETRSKNAAADLHEREGELIEAPATSLPIGLLITLGGGVMILVGASLMVSGAVTSARMLGVSEAVIGLTVVAIGTSLPELVAAIAAARRGETDLAFGNVLGSNLFNVLGILGITALVQPLNIAASLARFDIWILLATTVLMAVFAWTGQKLSRWEGIVFIVLYAAYMAFLALR